MSAAGALAARTPWLRPFILAILVSGLLAGCSPARAQSPASRPRSSSHTSDQDFDEGMALTRAQRWADAKRALEEGWRLAPRDERFPVELAGIAYKQRNNALAERRLHAALHLAPHDAYANDFLATLYFLDGNLEAALKYWNRVGKPQIASVRANPEPRGSPALLDHAFAFSPASTLTLPQYLATEARLRGLGIFPMFQLDLDERADGHFDATLRARELNGLGGAGWLDAFIVMRGLPFEAVEPGLWNLRRQAINFDSMLRWDKEKRRAFARISGPWLGGAKIRWEWGADLRNENWAIRNSFTGPAPVLASFNMRTEKGGFDLASYASGKFGWHFGAEVSHRDFRSVNPGTSANSEPVLTPQMLATGFELKPQAQFTGVLWRIPEHRFILSAGAESEAARLWSTPSESFEKLAGSLGWHWFPQRQGDDYETAQQLRAGRIFGQAPFDELYILGLERDNDLPMHAHIGTRDGLKGSAPLGREFFLENWELDKNLYANGLVKISLGPLLDIGRIAGLSPAQGGTALGSQEWMFDTGAALKLRVLGMGLAFSYGRDLRNGNNAYYVEGLNEGQP
jgi:hypothetical protein